MATQSSPPGEAAQELINQLQRQIGTKLFGLEQAVDELLMALMAGGHILLEDVPGVGKTALAKAFAGALGLTFQRIQCTPDLLPSDIVGGMVFHPGKSEFSLRKGPIFANILLVDELNRALPRTQSALLEAMAEGQVTIDRETQPLPVPFMVIATQNPLESVGVFPLPEAQLDRFLLKSNLGYPSPDHDIAILALDLGQSAATFLPHGPIPAPTLDGKSFLNELEAVMADVYVSPDMLSYIANVARATRNQPDVRVGASPRAMIMLARTAKAAAVLAGRRFVTPDDVQRVAARVLFHRIILSEATDEGGTDPRQWMNRVLLGVEVPIESGIR